ncbi:P-type DNA transfer ATPase VirB11 [Sphingomonas sp.]|uniref:P-type DNA transfer ATPase VirB11 n=1 Tax=Sphingomonas sp. TaxID=28214 RepID=UPI0025DE0D1F|nr:P-type DNA transfer ATPase VirB11 [Sphingomonas sp.]MBV9528432.1 P-type DNA transfer ATPase VirB11 [Sphingomonas sp.]
MNNPSRVYLDAFLDPLAEALARDDVTDVYINRPGEMWLETAKGVERCDNPALSDASLWRLARQIAASSDQGINREHPLLSATLPDGARVQICAPPATRGNVIVAIRKHGLRDLTLSDYISSGAFAHVGEAARSTRAVDEELEGLLAEGRTAEFLSLAVRRRKTMVISGGTGTGKTTFLNALLKEAPTSERFVLIEDTPEIRLHHENAVGLIAVRGRLGEASVSPAELVEAALRLRPDRIIMGEIRGTEAISWLRAVGTGHPGSITTLHANSPEGAVDQLAMLSMSAGTELNRSEIGNYIRTTVDVFVQLGSFDGERLVTDIVFGRKRQTPS